MSDLDTRLDRLTEMVTEIREKLGQLVRRDELENYVTLREYTERNKAVDDRFEGLHQHRQDADQERRHSEILANAKRYWWVPLAALLLKPDILLAVAQLLGAKP